MQLVAESMMYSQTYGYLFSRRASPRFGRYKNYTAYVTEACVRKRLADGRYTTASTTSQPSKPHHHRSTLTSPQNRCRRPRSSQSTLFNENEALFTRSSTGADLQRRRLCQREVSLDRRVGRCPMITSGRLSPEIRDEGIVVLMEMVYSTGARTVGLALPGREREGRGERGRESERATWCNMF